MKADFANGRIVVEWSETGALLIVNGARKFWVTDECLEDVILNMLQETVVVRKKWEDLVKASNEQARLHTKKKRHRRARDSKRNTA